MVVTDLPSTIPTGVAQARAAWPSICTVQAPHAPDAAAELRAGELEVLAQHPQERRVGVYADFPAHSIDREGNHALPPFAGETDFGCEYEPRLRAMSRQRCHNVPLFSINSTDFRPVVEWACIANSAVGMFGHVAASWRSASTSMESLSMGFYLYRVKRRSFRGAPP
jgi:hypothetical protein